MSVPHSASGEPTATAAGETNAELAGARWNRPLSWELIFRITPHLPRPVLFVAHHLTTAFCFVTLGKERRAARRNLARITGRTGLANMRDAYWLFYEFSRFMVAYATMRTTSMDALRSRIAGLEAVAQVTHELLSRGKGIIILTAHLGQWDLGLKLLCSVPTTIHAAMMRRESEAVKRHADGVRASPNLRIHDVGSSTMVGLELALALRRGEVVAVQMDRPIGHDDRLVPLFGAPAPLPTGPVHLAWASGAPLLPVLIVLEAGNRFRVVVHPPFELERPASREDREAALDRGMTQIAAALEAAIRDHPHQWFTFVDAWPQVAVSSDSLNGSHSRST